MYLYKTILFFAFVFSATWLNAQDEGEIIAEENKSFTGTSQWELIELLQLVALLSVLLLFMFYRRNKKQDGNPF